uniref:NADH dehydrogenase [ubiquinone] 1 alpha subcomplex assembly factor 4 n=1 Tax=Leptobrachium leishanense TaxID=445787 RepID=A0A8C5QX89_9ANUR
MGAKITRAFRNFNLENRAHRAISKDKTRAAPRHPGTVASQALLSKHSEIQDLVQKKDDQLLSRLKEVYVDSTDRSLEMESKVVPTSEQVDHRLPKLTARSEFSALVDVKSIPTGKVSILETLTILGNHRSYPDIWTAEKIAREFNLDVRDCQSLLEYFIPFTVKLIPRTNTKELTET